MNNNTEAVNDSHESAEIVYQNQKAARQANIAAVDRERDRRAWLARLAFAALALFLIVLIAAVIVGTRPVIIASVCFFALSAGFLVRVTRQITRLQKLRDQISEAESTARTQRENLRRQREGIRARDERDVVVEPAEWNATNHVRTDWVKGEAGALLSNDIVLKWNHGAWGGLCIERNGKIIADRQLWHIDW